MKVKYNFLNNGIDSKLYYPLSDIGRNEYGRIMANELWNELQVMMSRQFASVIETNIQSKLKNSWNQ